MSNKSIVFLSVSDDVVNPDFPTTEQPFTTVEIPPLDASDTNDDIAAWTHRCSSCTLVVWADPQEYFAETDVVP